MISSAQENKAIVTDIVEMSSFAGLFYPKKQCRFLR
jgi:hypothetical protein